MSAENDWLGDLPGIREIFRDGVAFIRRKALDFKGTGWAVVDNPSTGRTDISIDVPTLASTLAADPTVASAVAEAVSEDPALVASLAKAVSEDPALVQLGWFAVTGAAADENLLNVTKRGDLGGTFGVSANRVVVPSAGTYLAILRAELQYASPGDRSHYGALLNVAGSGQLWGGRARGVRFSGASMDAIGVLGLGVIGITDHTTDTIGVAASAPGGGELTVNAVTGSPDPCQLLLLRVSPAS